MTNESGESAGTRYRFERTIPMGHEARRDAVYRCGEFIGDVVYVARRKKAPTGSASATGFVTEYGWRPDGWRYAKNAKLTDRRGAVDRLRSVV